MTNQLATIANLCGGLWPNADVINEQFITPAGRKYSIQNEKK